MDKLQKVNGAIQKGWFEFAFEVDIIRAWLYLVDIVRDVDEGDDMDRKLSKNGPNDVGVEDFGLGSLLRQSFHTLDVVRSGLFSNRDSISYLGS